MMSMLLKKIFRYIEIDFQYLLLPLPISKKIFNILRTNISIFTNIILGRSIASVIFNDMRVQYDTPYATKTFCSAAYDFFMVSRRGEILSDKKTVVIDVGANIGQFLYAVNSFFPQAKIISIEPDPSIYKLLKHNATNLKNVTTYNYALSDKNKNMKFYKSKQFSEWSSLKKTAGNEYEEIEVIAKTGDEVLKSFSNIDLLKVDVEGAELEVLTGLKKTIKKCRYILIELSLDRHVENTKTDELVSLLLSNHFTIFHIGRIFSEGSGKRQAAVDMLFKNSLR